MLRLARRTVRRLLGRPTANPEKSLFTRLTISLLPNPSEDPSPAAWLGILLLPDRPSEPPR